MIPFIDKNKWFSHQHIKSCLISNQNDYILLICTVYTVQSTCYVMVNVLYLCGALWATLTALHAFISPGYHLSAEKWGYTMCLYWLKMKTVRYFSVHIFKWDHTQRANHTVTNADHSSKYGVGAYYWWYSKVNNPCTTVWQQITLECMESVIFIENDANYFDIHKSFLRQSYIFFPIINHTFF